MSNDIVLSFRLLRRSPGFTAAAVLTMGLGIGATTAIFSVLDATLLRVVPFPNADRIVYVSGITAPPAQSRIAYFSQAQTLQNIAEFDVGIGGKFLGRPR